MIKVLRAVPEFIRFQLEVVDKEKEDDSTKIVSLKGYVKGAGCPVPIAMEVNRIWADYDEQYPTGEQIEKMSIYRHRSETSRVEWILRRDLLCAVIPELDVEDANVMAQDDGAWLQILRELKWGWQESTNINDVDETKGEVTGVETGDSTSQTLQPSTQE